jgi:hypothetical protein
MKANSLEWVSGLFAPPACMTSSAINCLVEEALEERSPLAFENLTAINIENAAFSLRNDEKPTTG